MMFRALAIATCYVIVVIRCLASAPAGANVEPYYFPIKVGAKWVYEWSDSSGKEEATLQVSAVKEQRGAYIVTVDSVSEDGNELVEVISVSKTGLCRLQLWNSKLNPPFRMLVLPFVKGRKWQNDTANYKGSSVIERKERVVILAGTFDAIRVQSEYTLDGNDLSRTCWYAPNIGLIKSVSGDRLQVLKSFQPGKP
jgi:hypothetical protein